MRKKEWIAIELTQKGEDEQNIVKVESALTGILGADVEIFIPIHYSSNNIYKKKIYLLKGYYFVVNRYSSTDYLKLKNSPYFEGPVIDQAQERLSIIDNKEIQRMKRQLKKLCKGEEVREEDKVLITDGTFRGMQGIVINIESAKQATVKVTTLESFTPMVTLPILSLEVLHDKEETAN